MTCKMCFPPLVHMACWFDIEVLRFKCGFFFGPGAKQLPSLCEIGHFVDVLTYNLGKFGAFGSATINYPFQIEHVDPYPRIFLDLTNEKLCMLQHYHVSVDLQYLFSFLWYIQMNAKHTWANTTSLQWSWRGFFMKLCDISTDDKRAQLR